MPAKIVIIEDERKIALGLQAYLENAGYAVLTAADGQLGLELVRRERPDLVLLDLMLPGLDGLEVCRRIRREQTTAIIMLTARIEEADRLVGLELGADDYVAKPFSPREVLARVKAVLRRTLGELAPPAVLRRADIELDLDRRSLKVAGAPVTTLTPTEFELLAALMRSAGRPWSRSQLLDALQGDEGDSYDRTIDAHIKNLRRKIEPQPAAPRYILTVYGIGYKFADDER